MSVERLRRHPGHPVLPLSQRAGRISTAVDRDGSRASVLTGSGPRPRKEIGDAAGIGDPLFEGLTAAERDQLAELLPKARAHHEARR